MHISFARTKANSHYAECYRIPVHGTQIHLRLCYGLRPFMPVENCVFLFLLRAILTKFYLAAEVLCLHFFLLPPHFSSFALSLPDHFPFVFILVFLKITDHYILHYCFFFVKCPMQAFYHFTEYQITTSILPNTNLLTDNDETVSNNLLSDVF